MPFTPFHFGPGLFLKSIAPRWCSLTSFVATQVLIDLESLYNLLYQRWPVHRFLHSIPGGVLAGLVAAGLLGAVRRWVPGLHRLPPVEAELRWRSLVVGGLLGGVTHTVLDALFHTDVRLLYPLADRGPLQGMIGRDAIQWGCLALGLVGAGIVMARSRRNVKR